MGCCETKGELIDDNSQNNCNITFGNGNNTIFNNIDIDENKNIKKDDFIKVKGKGIMGGKCCYKDYLYLFHKDAVLNTTLNDSDIIRNDIKTDDFIDVKGKGIMGGKCYCKDYLYSFHKDLVLNTEKYAFLNGGQSVFFNYSNDGHCYISNFKMGTIEGQELESVKFYRCHSKEDKLNRKNFIDGKENSNIFYKIFGLRDPNGNTASCLISFNKEANKDLIERLERNKEKKDNTYNNYDRRDINNNKIKKNILDENIEYNI